MLTVRLYMLQRITALLMAPLVLGHLGGDDLCSAGRAVGGGNPGPHTRSALRGCCSMAGFVIAVSVHAAIGLRVDRA